jgi:hypothetical protein
MHTAADLAARSIDAFLTAEIGTRWYLVDGADALVAATDEDAAGDRAVYVATSGVTNFGDTEILVAADLALEIEIAADLL